MGKWFGSGFSAERPVFKHFPQFKFPLPNAATEMRESTSSNGLCLPRSTANSSFWEVGILNHGNSAEKKLPGPNSLSIQPWSKSEDVTAFEQRCWEVWFWISHVPFISALCDWLEDGRIICWIQQDLLHKIPGPSPFLIVASDISFLLRGRLYMTWWCVQQTPNFLKNKKQIFSRGVWACVCAILSLLISFLTQNLSLLLLFLTQSSIRLYPYLWVELLGGRDFELEKRPAHLSFTFKTTSILSCRSLRK